MQDFSKQVVAKVEGRDVTQGELSAAFDWVANRSNWKLPIDVTVALSNRQVELVKVAVPFFAGCPADCAQESNGAWRILAVGYYAAVGA